MLIPGLAFARIEDNSFLLEEAYNQEWGVYQFIQKYQSSDKYKLYDYVFENDIPVTDKTHQFTYAIPYQKADANEKSGVGDVGLNWRIQPYNKNGVMLAERFGIVLPTGKVDTGAGNGVFGFEFMQAATININDRWSNHWNIGFRTMPNAKSAGIDKKRTLTNATAGSSLIFVVNDSFDLMFEGLLDSGQSVDADGVKTSSTTLTINPGFRFAIDLDWKETQIVPGISFPTEILNSPSEHAVLVYFSIEPKFY